VLQQKKVVDQPSRAYAPYLQAHITEFIRGLFLCVRVKHWVDDLVAATRMCPQIEIGRGLFERQQLTRGDNTSDREKEREREKKIGRLEIKKCHTDF
jgi:hypothetical protein